MARYRSKDPLPGLFLIGLACVGICCFVRFKAWQADGRLRTWVRAEATVGAVERFTARSGRYGTRTRYNVQVRYQTPAGPVDRRVVLNSRPASGQVAVYYDPTDLQRDPEPEVQL